MKVLHISGTNKIAATFNPSIYVNAFYLFIKLRQNTYFEINQLVEFEIYGTKIFSIIPYSEQWESPINQKVNTGQQLRLSPLYKSHMLN